MDALAVQFQISNFRSPIFDVSFFPANSGSRAYTVHRPLNSVKVTRAMDPLAAPAVRPTVDLHRHLEGSLRLPTLW